MKAYQSLKNALGKLDCMLITKRLDEHAKNLCMAHPEWVNLNREEKDSIIYHKSRGGEYSYKAFKNMTGVKGEELRLFVPESFYRSQVLVRTNRLNHCTSGRNYHSLFEDKCYLDKVMPEIRTPHTIVKKICNTFFDDEYNMISKEQALTKMSDYDKLVFKISKGTGHGSGVSVVEAPNFERVLTEYGSDFVIQPIMKQSDELAYFNESSVNVVRVTSLNLKGNVYILGAILRVGLPGSFCELESIDGRGYLAIPIENGKYGKQAYDTDYGFIYNDVFGKPIPKGNFPKYDEIERLVKNNHAKFPDYGIIGWDFAIDCDENVVCFEMNTRNPGVIASQYALGPIFGKKDIYGNTIIDEILKLPINEKIRPTI